MRKIFLLSALLLASPLVSASNISGVFFTAHAKVPRQDLWPRTNCSSCTLTDNWDGVTARMFGAKGETVFGLFYLQVAGGSNATNVNVTISSFTGPSGSGIVPVVVSSVNVWNADASGPVNLFYLGDLQIRGLSRLQWDPSLYEERDLPERFQNPCTPNVNNDCIASIPTKSLWTTRADGAKFYPEIAIPMEEMTSSFTVFASSSQAVGLDVRISTTLAAGSYTALLTIKEGVVFSTSVPIQLTVYNFSLPEEPSLRVIADVSGTDINLYHQNNEFPPTGAPYMTTREHYYQFLRRHSIIPIGDDQINSCGNGAQDYPCPEYAEQLDGSLFTAARGYAGRSLGLPVPFYMIGTYGSWNHASFWSATRTGGGATGFCTNISSWSVNMASYPTARTAFYTIDEPQPASLVANAEKYARWMSTSCVMSGNFINSWVTSNWTTVASSAPHITMPASTQWIANGYTQTDWINAAAQYETSGSTQGWMYNGHPSWSGTMYATEDDGISPMVPFVAAKKKGVSGVFLWQTTSWDITGAGLPAHNDLFGDAKTFGYRNQYVYFTLSGITTAPTCDYTDTSGNQYQRSNDNLTGTSPSIAGIYQVTNIASPTAPPNPTAAPLTLTKVPGQCGGSACSCVGDATLSASTWTITYIDLTSGSSGPNYGNGDGVLLYPGTDLQDPTNSYGFDGPIASLRLKFVRNGIQLADYITMANVVNASSTTAIVNTLLPSILFERACFTNADCSYTYGGRTWSNDPQVWEAAKEQLAQIILGPADHPSPISTPLSITGRVTISGQATTSH